LGVLILSTEITIDDAPPPPPSQRAKKRKLVKEPVSVTKSTARGTGTSNEPATVNGNSSAVHMPKKKSEKHAAKYATMIASNSIARNIFTELDEIRKLNETI